MIPAVHGAVNLAVLPLPWEKETRSPFHVTGCFWSSGVESQSPSCPSVPVQRTGCCRRLPWMSLPNLGPQLDLAEVGQGEAQESSIQQQLCNFGQVVGLQVALQLTGVITLPYPS